MNSFSSKACGRPPLKKRGTITLHSPSKINLYLDIINKRKDGYHNIETVFQKIDLFDKVKIAISEKEISLDCQSPHIPPYKSNLAYKAAFLMKEKFRLKEGIDIKIEKHIPVAAGLGGGSSDAASVIIGINKLFKLRIDTKNLMRLGSRIGADVPFLISNYSCALGKGIGDRLKQIRHANIFHVLLVVPQIRVYTKTIYSKISLPLTKYSSSANISNYLLSHDKKVDKLTRCLYNRLEEVTLNLYPIVRKAKEKLSFYSEAALVSGSGPTVFALFIKRKEAIKARDELMRDGRWQLLLAKTI